MGNVSQKEAELTGLGDELERLQRSLAAERESSVKAAEALQNQLNEKVNDRQTDILPWEPAYQR